MKIKQHVSVLYAGFFSMIIFLICENHIFSQNRNFEVVNRCLEKRAQFESMSYTLAINHKAFADNDTFNHVAQIELVRDLSDSLFGGICTIDMDSIWYGYDGHHILRASPGEGTLLVVDATQHPMFYIKGSLVDNFVDYGFLKLSQGLKNYLQEPDISVTFSDTMIGHWPCLGILFKLPDQEDITDQTFFIAIDTIEYHFRNKVYSAYFQGNQQYTNWDYKQVQYGHNTHIEKLQEANLAKFNNIVQYESDTAKQETLNEFDFKLLTGRVLTKDESFRIIDVHAKYTILDFWYSSCYPCIKSIPAVNQIYQGYKDKGVMVCGVNPVDDPIKSKTRLDKFLLNNPMGYETIMVDKQIGQSVCAAGYPTFIILDHNYKVVYKETGYNENLYNEVSAFLDDALKQSK